MRDLLLIVPSRGRPASVARLVQALGQTVTTEAELALALDDDDPTRHEAEGAARSSLFPVSVYQGRRQTWAGWTNDIAVRAAPGFRAVCSLGDDHVPLTSGWDRLLLDAIEKAGGTGFAYPNDLLQGYRLPTAVVVSSDIVRALGWLCEPSLKHYYADAVWKALGDEAGCIRYLPYVAIEHHHHARTGQTDDTYAEAQAHWLPDTAAYRAWCQTRKNADVLKIKALQA